MGRIKLGDWYCDPQTRTLSRDGETIQIENKVMQTLQYLAHRAPQVVSKKELLENVWPNVYVEDNAVYRVIALLRKALGDNSKQPSYIQSIPRQGYRFVAPCSVEPQSTDSAKFSTDTSKVSLSIASRKPLANQDLSDLIRGIERYASWRHPSLLVRPSNSDLATDYQVQVSVDLGQSEQEYQWETLYGVNQEFVHAGLHKQDTELVSPVLESIHELIAEDVIENIFAHRMSLLGSDPDPADLGLWDLIIYADPFVKTERNHLLMRQQMFREALRRDPNNAWTLAAWSNFRSWELSNGLADDAALALSESKASAFEAITLQKNQPFVLCCAGMTLGRIGLFDQSIALCERAARIAPSTRTRDAWAFALLTAGKPWPAAELYQQTYALLPSGQLFHYGKLTTALTMTGQFVKAIHFANLATHHFPLDYFTWALRCNLFGHMGRLAEAEADLKQAKQILPSLTIDTLRRGLLRSYGRTATLQRRLVAGLTRLEEHLKQTKP